MVGGNADLPPDLLRDAALAALRREASGTVAVDLPGGAASVFLEVFPRHPRLVIFGATHVAVALVPLARRLGYHTIVPDGRVAADGFTPDEIARIRGSIGLDLGGRAPPETALAILAEMTRVRYGVQGEGRR
jgi:xanthine dehydrogenase accessory factor